MEEKRKYNELTEQSAKQPQQEAKQEMYAIALSRVALLYLQLIVIGQCGQVPPRILGHLHENSCR